MKTSLILLVLALALKANVQAQNNSLLNDKKGTFRILSRTDYAGSLKFSQSDMTANLEQLKKLVAIVQQNPVLSGLAGFNAQARLDPLAHSVGARGKIRESVEAIVERPGRVNRPIRSQ